MDLMDVKSIITVFAIKGNAPLLLTIRKEMTALEMYLPFTGLSVSCID